MKSLIRIVHQWFNLNLMKQRAHFFCAKKKQRLYSTIRLLIQRSAILENSCWTQAAYALLCQLCRTDMSPTYIYALI